MATTIQNYSICLGVAVGLVWTSCAYAEAMRGVVVGVSDGDTVKLLAGKEIKVRLAGIDAPEKAQPYGQTSKHALSRLVYGKEVTAECGKTDRYGRLICKLLVGGADANLAQVRAGMAWHYKQYEREQAPLDRSRYAAAEDAARAGRAGLWSDANPMSPWDWRRAKKAPQLRRRRHETDDKAACVEAADFC